ncbi:MAG: hypothetical protein GX444_07240 [Myxococcales bacterium]|nr:hypothetical protein [Myxococcales bacterium]
MQIRFSFVGFAATLALWVLIIVACSGDEQGGDDDSESDSGQAQDDDDDNNDNNDTDDDDDDDDNDDNDDFADYSVCNSEGWCWQNPWPVGGWLAGVWGTSSEDMYFVGDRGVILHFDGVIFSALASNTTEPLTAVWGLSSSDIYAVGGTTVVHYDGVEWAPVVAEERYQLNDVHGFSSADVWVVGYDLTNYEDVILHFDGLTWAIIPGVAGIHFLMDVWGNSPTEVYAVGRSDVLRFDGFTWSLMYHNSENTWASFHTIEGTAADNILVGFNEGPYYSLSGGIVDYTNGEWSWPDSYLGSIEDIKDISGQAVFAVGMECLGSPMGWGSCYSLFYRYDNPAWTELTDQQYGGLNGVGGSSPTDVYAVGSDCADMVRPNRILHYDGSTVEEISKSLTITDLKAVWGSSADDVYVGGGMYFIEESGGVILHFDGTHWSVVQRPDGWVLSIWGTSPSDVYALATANGSEILHYDGNTWSTMASSPELSLQALWGTSSSDIFAVGTHVILHYDGVDWKEMLRHPELYLLSVWGSSSTDVYAVGEGGVILHYDGADWAAMASGTDHALLSVWGSSPTDIYAAGGSTSSLPYDLLLHFDGSAWSEVTGLPAAAKTSVWGSSASDVFVVSDGAILHFDGTSWKVSETNAPERWLQAVGGTLTGNAFAVGIHGAILKYTNEVED